MVQINNQIKPFKKNLTALNFVNFQSFYDTYFSNLTYEYCKKIVTSRKKRILPVKLQKVKISILWPKLSIKKICWH